MIGRLPQRSELRPTHGDISSNNELRNDDRDRNQHIGEFGVPLGDLRRRERQHRGIRDEEHHDTDGEGQQPPIQKKLLHSGQERLIALRF